MLFTVLFACGDPASFVTSNYFPLRAACFLLVDKKIISLCILVIRHHMCSSWHNSNRIKCVFVSHHSSPDIYFLKRDPIVVHFQ